VGGNRHAAGQLLLKNPLAPDTARFGNPRLNLEGAGMWAEIVDGKIYQVVADDAPVITATGTQYPWSWVKSTIPNLYPVALATAPDPAVATVTGYSVEIVNGLPAQILTTQPVPPVPLSQIQAERVATLRVACATAITGGYTSSALGTPHTYPNGATDQVNMLGSVAASLLPNLPAGWVTQFWCEDAAGAWAYQAHTAEQIQQAGADGKAWVTTCQIKLATLVGAVNAATDSAGVEAVTW
jgi:hypothetical protein